MNDESLDDWDRKMLQLHREHKKREAAKELEAVGKAVDALIDFLERHR